MELLDDVVFKDAVMESNLLQERWIGWAQTSAMHIGQCIKGAFPKIILMRIKG